MNILFLHGLEGTPNGSKVKFLKAMGHTVVAPALPKNCLFESRKIAQEEFDSNGFDIVIGSSRGGAIAAGLEGDPKIPRILIAPAYRAFGIDPIMYNEYDICYSVDILHCPEDDLVPISFSEELERKLGKTNSVARLHRTGKDHRMSDPTALGKLAVIVKEIENKKFFQGLLKNIREQVRLNG